MRSTLLLFLLFPCFLSAHILVSIPPQKYLVERLTEGKIEVRMIVPKGASPHSFEPSPKDIERLKGARLWFCCAESFEGRLERALESRVKRVSQLEGLDLLYEGCCCHCGVDTHVWLSPSRLKIIAKKMAHTLSEEYPDLKQTTDRQLSRLLQEISTLEENISKTPFSESVLVSHPAFGYFCRDYGITQLSIEVDGKEPSPKQATKLMNVLREKKVSSLFVQEQYSQRAAIRFANELELKLIPLDPYAEDVLANLETIREAFADA
jgi:zinc transport system substrate-binding protein